MEAFFYVVYAGVAKLIARRQWPAGRVIDLSAASYLAVVMYLFGCAYLQPEIDRAGLALFGPVATVATAYDTSLLRWLLFQPGRKARRIFSGHGCRASFSRAKVEPRVSSVHSGFHGRICGCRGGVGNSLSPL